jgi:outer membrane receptor protein involved in Fe transport
MKFIKMMIALCLALPLYSQTGKIAGTITDQDSGETLISSYVFVEGTEQVEASDFDGKYSIELTPGIYSLKFTYIGFADKTVSEIEVKAGEVTYLDVAMSEGSQQLDEVVVTAKIIDKTENSVLLLRKKSDQIQDGLSAQEMRTFAVGNVASAVTKVTAVSVEDGKYVNIRGLGDRYSITQLNGLSLPSIDPYRNSAQLDLIPTNLLDNIITSKTFSPDQPGNFAGGNLNIKTKSFPEERTLSVSMSTGYNSQNNLTNNFLQYDGAKTDWLGYGRNERARPDFFSDESVMEYMDKNAQLEAKILGDDLAASTIDRVVDAVDLNFLSRQVTSPVNHGLSLSYGNSWNSGSNGRIGLIAAASYKNSFNNLPEVIEKRWFLSDINAGELENIGDYAAHRSTSNPVVNGLLGLAYKFNPLNSISLNVIYNHNTSKETQYVFGEKPENIIDPTFFEGRANLFEEREMTNYQLSGDHVLPFLNNAKVEWSGSLVNARMDQPNLRFFSNQYNSETGNFSIPLSNVEDPLLFWRDLSDNVINGKVDIEIPLNINIFKSSKIKFGGLASRKDRDFNEFRYLVYSPPSAQRFNGDFEAFVGEDAVGVLAVEDKGNKNSYTIGNYLIDATRADNSYNGNEDISAGYLMANIQVVDKFKIVAGARLETTDINVKSKNELRADSLRIGEIKSNDILPSVNLIYNVSDNMNLRASYNKTLARPNLREIAPFVAFDPLTGDFIIGNTQLKRTNITNVDVRWELFLQPGEIVSAGVFYKHFTNPIVEQYLNSSNPERQYANVDEGEIYGLELEFRKNLGFIAPMFNNLKFGSNVAFIQSFTNVNDQTGLEPTERPFTGQAPFLANVNLTYTEPTSNLAANLAYNYIGRRLSNIARNGTPDVYNAALNTLDFSLSKKFGSASLALNAKNLLNAKFEQSSTFKGRTFVYQSYRRGISFGLSLRVDI